MIDTTIRTSEAEIMDDFFMQGHLLEDALDKIAGINRLLGGNKVTLNGVIALLKRCPPGKAIRIIDIGCGNGDILRMLSTYSKKHDLKLELTGIDANPYTIEHARNLSQKHDIFYNCLNIFDNGFQAIQYDIALFTLTLHHFKNADILPVLKMVRKNAAVGIVINDLERSKLAYRLFQLFCFIFGLSDMPRQDGLVSILRGFKIKELRKYAADLNAKNHILRRRWAFRLQWIILKT